MSGFVPSHLLDDDDDDDVDDDVGEDTEARPIFRRQQRSQHADPRSKLTRELLREQGGENILQRPPPIVERKNLDAEEFAKDPEALAKCDGNSSSEDDDDDDDDEKATKTQTNAHLLHSALYNSMAGHPIDSYTAQLDMEMQYYRGLAAVMPPHNYYHHHHHNHHDRPLLQPQGGMEQEAASRRAATTANTATTTSLCRALSQQENMDPQGQMRLMNRPHREHGKKIVTERYRHLATVPPQIPLRDFNHQNKDDGYHDGAEESEQPQLKKHPLRRQMALSLPGAQLKELHDSDDDEDDEEEEEEEEEEETAKASGDSVSTDSPLVDTTTATSSARRHSEKGWSSSASDKRACESGFQLVWEAKASDNDAEEDEEQDQSMTSPLRSECTESPKSKYQAAPGMMIDAAVDSTTRDAKEEEEEEDDDDGTSPVSKKTKAKAKANISTAHTGNVVDPFKADLQATRAHILQDGQEKRKNHGWGGGKGALSATVTAVLPTRIVRASATRNAAKIANVKNAVPANEKGAAATGTNGNMLLARQDSTRTVQTSHVDGRKRKHDDHTGHVARGDEPDNMKKSWLGAAAENLSSTEPDIDDVIDEFCDSLQSSVFELRLKMKQAMGKLSPNDGNDRNAEAADSKDVGHLGLYPPAHGSQWSSHANALAPPGIFYPPASQVFGGYQTYRPPSVPPFQLPGPHGGGSTLVPQPNVPPQPLPTQPYYAMDPFAQAQPFPRARPGQAFPEMFGLTMGNPWMQYGAHPPQMGQDSGQPSSGPSYAGQKNGSS